ATSEPEPGVALAGPGAETVRRRPSRGRSCGWDETVRDTPRERPAWDPTSRPGSAHPTSRTESRKSAADFGSPERPRAAATRVPPERASPGARTPAATLDPDTKREPWWCSWGLHEERQLEC